MSEEPKQHPDPAAQLKTALRLAQERFEEMAKLEEVKLLCSAGGTILQANTAVEKLLGHPVEEIIGKSLLSFADLRDKQDLGRMLEWLSTERSDGILHGIFPFLHSEGSEHILKWEVANLLDEPEIQALFVKLCDITESKREEEELRTTNQLLNAFIEKSSEGMSLADIEGHYLIVNQAFCEMTGYSREALLHMGIHDIIPKGKSSVLLPMIQQGQSGTRMGQIVHREGEIVDVEASGHPIELRGKRLALGILRDVTAREQAKKALREENAFRSSVIKCASEGLCVCHSIHEFPHVRFTVWNDRMTEITGHTMEGINSAGWYQSLYPDPELQRYAMERMGSMREGDDLLCEHWEITRADGEKRDIAISSSLLLADDGAAHVMALIQDVSERIRAERDRDHLLQEIEARNAELERFSYTVSHDLKGPLITIKGFLGFLQKDVAAGNLERLQEDAQHISEATTKMATLLDHILELSRIGRIVNPSSDVPMAELVHEAISRLQGSIDERGVTLHVWEDLPTLHGDRERLIEVFQNLIENAVKYMGAQAEPRIEIGAEEKAEELRYFVKDNGMGIEPPYHEKIFGLFDRLDTGTAGTGVGLAIVERVVTFHGGSIWVESAGAGTGSTFYFTLDEKNTST